MIEAGRLVKSFGDTFALRGVDLAIGEGEAVALIGPNGAGKTTLLRILAGLNRPTQGWVRIAGHDLATAPEMARRLVGFLSHQPLLYEDLTAEENLRFYGKMYRVPALAERMRVLLTRVGLTTRRESLVRTYSRGMKQRLAIARALLHDPPVLLLDEPYTGLDQQATEILDGLLDEMGLDSRTVVLTTHSLDQGLSRCQNALLLVNGRIERHLALDGVDRESLREIYRQHVARHEVR